VWFRAGGVDTFAVVAADGSAPHAYPEAASIVSTRIDLHFMSYPLQLGTT
jgi:hypothetical protein